MTPAHTSLWIRPALPSFTQDLQEEGAGEERGACVLGVCCLTLIPALVFCPTVLFLTQRRVQSSETLKLNVAKGLTQALRKAFHQNDVSAYVSPLLL